MSKINSLLSLRFKKAPDKLTKMTSLAEMSSNGALSSFSGVFRVSNLTQKEQEELLKILTEYGQEEADISPDLNSLMAITAEVKAINSQAAILHGERIKRAQDILKKYQDGAFSAWLVATYGNRQTPYNFLQYYELYTALPQLLQPKLDEMPKQAVYTLASRNAPIEQKEEIIRSYQGQPKQELIALIRQRFPLAEGDGRAQDLSTYAISYLRRLHKQLSSSTFHPTPEQKRALKKQLKSLQALIDERP